MRNQKGFSLIELLLVVSVILIISAIAIPNFLRSRLRANEASAVASVVMEFAAGQAVFTCSTQMVPYQRMQFMGTKGRIEIEIPFNASSDRPTRIFIDDGRDVFGTGIRTENIPACDQYTIQGDAFSRAIREGREVPVPLEDAIANMAVIEAAFRAAESGKWEKPEAV